LTEPIYSELDYRNAPLPLIEINPIDVDARIDHKYPIDRALSQVLDPIGVKFQSSIQRLPPAQDLNLDSEYTVLQSPDSLFQSLEYRLWVVCSSQKSLDYKLLAEPLAKTLRSLDLHGFQDATIRFSQSGAQATDWRLRVDLAPPAVMLRDWARWGDVQSITKLLNFALAPVELQVSTVLKNLTLHIFCTLNNGELAKFPTKKIALDLIAPLLIELTPQGIQGATIYGLKSQTTGSQVTESPVWTHWLDLPALGDPIFSPTPLLLAERGDLDAIDFVLHRFLNPDLEQCFAVGGIKLSLLSRRGLLHVMSEAPVCPLQSQVAAPVVKILTQLALPGIRGVRVHGRVAGQSRPLWTYGVDFDRRPLELPPAAPEQVFVADPSITKISLAQRLSQYLVATQIWQPQLSAGKTSQLVHQRRFQWQPSLLLLLVGLGLAIGGDLGLTAFMTATQLTATSPSAPSQLSFNNPLLEQKLAQYQVQCVQHGVPDVLIIGSSRALRGIDPDVLRRSRGNKDLKVYNFGINGATAQVVDLILRQLLTPQQLPKLVIWADGARAFNSGRVDRTYETIALSDRYRQLALMSGMGTNSSSILQAQSSFKNTYQAIDSTADLQLAQISPVYHHRDLLKTWLQAQVPFVSQIVAGSNAIVNDLTPSNQEPQIDAEGFLPLDVRFDPTTYYQEHPKVTGDSDGDYANFQLLGGQHQALQQVTNLLSTHNIPLVFVNLPVSDFYADKFRRERETKFKQYMQQFVDLHQLTFVDMDGFLNTQSDRFSDPSHLNQFGAREVSRYLAQTTLIPWQVVNSEQ
jgi:hypothetical protein